jgi:hypothetical protein
MIGGGLDQGQEDAPPAKARHLHAAGLALETSEQLSEASFARCANQGTRLPPFNEEPLPPCYAEDFWKGTSRSVLQPPSVIDRGLTPPIRSASTGTEYT